MPTWGVTDRSQYTHRNVGNLEILGNPHLLTDAQVHNTSRPLISAGWWAFAKKTPGTRDEYETNHQGLLCLTHVHRKMGVSRNAGTPIAGWFIRGKNILKGKI